MNDYSSLPINAEPEGSATKFILFCTVPVVTGEQPPVLDFLPLSFRAYARNLAVLYSVVRFLTFVRNDMMRGFVRGDSVGGCSFGMTIYSDSSRSLRSVRNDRGGGCSFGMT